MSVLCSIGRHISTFGLSLIVLNMVRAVRVSADRIEIDLVMRGACPGCPAGELTLAQVRQNLAALNGGDVLAESLTADLDPALGTACLIGGR